ncbi:MAG: type II toxin-antitoxin system RelE/ParE family toxin [Candidatus Kapabacteria bacterium]|nr:type II toxin-antitoxin system RelE/ParE family toxin [Candidatus Kapabacteria bacterium]
MLHALKITLTAQQDLANVHSYLIDAGSMELADRFLGEVRQTMEALRQFPLIGAMTQYAINQSMQSLRRVLVWNHVVVYYVVDATIVIVAVVDARRDVVMLLAERSQRTE